MLWLKARYYFASQNDFVVGGFCCRADGWMAAPCLQWALEWERSCHHRAADTIAWKKEEKKWWWWRGGGNWMESQQWTMCWSGENSGGRACVTCVMEVIVGCSPPHTLLPEGDLQRGESAWRTEGALCDSMAERCTVPRHEIKFHSVQ